MYKENDYVVYKKDVCKIREIKKIHDKEYYIMFPIDDDTLKISVPMDNSFIKPIISKEEANILIQKIPFIKTLNMDEKNLENDYKKLLQENNLESLITIIKTTYLRNEKRAHLKKKISEKDESYFEKAENRLYNELSISLGMNYDETKKYIIQIFEK